MSDVCYLIEISKTYDTIGQEELTEIKQKRYCKVASVSASEFFNASQSGLKADLKLTMNRFDYDGETLVEYKSKKYKIYRHYILRETIELYLTECVGL